MYISHHHKCIFFHVPKTAGNTIRVILRNDMREKGLPDKFDESYNSLGHLSVQKGRKLIDKRTWDSYFKFAFVRNPWERLVSRYFYILQYEKDQEKHRKVFEETSKKSSFHDWFMDNDHILQSQYDFLKDDNSRLSLDFIGRFEQFHTDLGVVKKYLGINAQFIPEVFKTRKKHYSLYYKPSSRKRARGYLKQDIQAFGYTFNQQPDV